jgi:hypothetical protein
MYAMSEHSWQGIPPFRPQLLGALLGDWLAPPSDGWLFAGLATDPFLASQLVSYANNFQVPLILILGAGLSSRAEDTSTPTLAWPLSVEPDMDTSALHNTPRADTRCNTKLNHCPGRMVLLGCLPVHSDSHTMASTSLPLWLTHWPMLYRDYSPPDDFDASGVTRSTLIESLAADLCNRADKPWWWSRTGGAAGQAALAGIWTETLGAALRRSAEKHAASTS